MNHKESKTKTHSPVQQYSSQITLATSRLGVEEGVGRTKKKTNTKNLQSSLPQCSGAISQTMAQH